jgi:hypothetical protein
MGIWAEEGTELRRESKRLEIHKHFVGSEIRGFGWWNSITSTILPRWVFRDLLINNLNIYTYIQICDIPKSWNELAAMHAGFAS